MVRVCGSFCPVPVVDTDVISCIELHTSRSRTRVADGTSQLIGRWRLQVWLPFVSACDRRSSRGPLTILARQLFSFFLRLNFGYCRMCNLLTHFTTHSQLRLTHLHLQTTCHHEY